jgi:hypothetical protein
VGTPFKFEVEAKTFEKAGADGETERWIGGFVSTDHLDRQQEVLVQEGLDFAPFLKHGFFNDNHDRATGAAVGRPKMAEIRDLANGHRGWYVEGKLYKTKRADEIWDLANALHKDEDARSLGYSVEGSIQDRDPENPKSVRKAVVSEVAVTRCPVNPNASLSILAKSLSAGGSVADPGTSPGEGFPLRTESLEGGPKRKRKRKRKKMKKSEAVEMVMRLPALQSVPVGKARAFATRLVDYTLRWHADAV